ncbi:MAG: single-stranded-DNA-specific exonuclease RecJ [Alphaproteobacteria bacterium]|nr:single-stranded-DNA-specific exonuclease RecJ [Alphaproteobacteria bacterium]
MTRLPDNQAIADSGHPVIRSSGHLSLTGRAWGLRSVDERQVSAIMQQHDLPEILARVMVSRGVTTEEVTDFLNPSLKASLPDPSHLLDMDVAAARIASAVISGEKIAIFGDYDVDGATSSALLMRYFRALGMEPFVHIPDRMKEGYGPNIPALLGLQARGAKVVVTVDCGTLSFEPIAAASDAGLDVIVIDHHIGEAARPKALAIVNPNRLDETSPHRQMAAVGVAFLFCVAINKRLRDKGFFKGRSEPDLRQWLDIVALGTVCDVVPLTGVNRAFVAQGLKVMAARQNTGIRTVLDMVGIDEKPSVYHLGFVIGPRINAGGRVGKSDLGVRLLTEVKEWLQAMVLEQAMRLAEVQDGQSPLLLVAAEGWHPGVIGIVAGRLKEKYHKPVAVIGVSDGIGKASARSVSGMDFGAAVIAARDAGLLIAGGGHAMAAGFTVEEAKIPALEEFLAARLAPQAGVLTGARSLILDGLISVAGATPELAETIEKLGPFGQGNPSLRMAVQNVVNLKPDIVGQHHVKTLLVDKLSNARLSAICFRCVGTPLGDALLSTRGQVIDVAGQMRLNEWLGKISVSFQVDDIKLS